MIKILLIPVLKDNYAYLLVDGKNCAVIDPGESAPVIEFIEDRGLKLSHILNTHHHWDHTDGNLEIKAHFGCTIIGPEKDRVRIPGLDVGLSEGDEFTLFGHEVQIFETPGHTSGHICFYIPDLQAVFTGDTLFSMGCGRLFEGTAEEMWGSFQKILSLPDKTLIYCGHEYTLGNAAFCFTVEPDNVALKARYEEVKSLRTAGQPTLPVSLAMEKKTNVFLRAESAERFAEIRTLKDNF